MSDLEDCEESFTYLLESAAEQVRAGVDVASSCQAIETAQRVLATCALLGQADPDLFVERLDRAATARWHLLRQVAAGMPCEPRGISATRALGFFAALASGNLKLGSWIADLRPRSHAPEWEYEEDFLFVDFLRQAALGLAAGGSWSSAAASNLARWDQVLEGRDSPTAAACKAVALADGPGFASSFETFLAKRLKDLDAYRSEVNFDPQMYAVEGHVYIEGIALLEVAGRAGLPVEPQYPLIPSLARAKRSERSGESPDWMR
jgi:hypothetical protein